MNNTLQAAPWARRAVAELGSSDFIAPFSDPPVIACVHHHFVKNMSI
jgi:hypothetical protein